MYTRILNVRREVEMTIKIKKTGSQLEPIRNDSVITYNAGL